MYKCPVLTTAAGTPIADNQNSETAGPRGPVLLQDCQRMEKRAHFNRERVAERVVHAKGAGAHGRLTTTHNLARCTRAPVCQRRRHLRDVRPLLHGRRRVGFGRYGPGDEPGGGDLYSQAGALFRLIRMRADQKSQLFVNLVTPLKTVPRFIQLPQLGHFDKADPDDGARVAAALGGAVDDIDGRQAA